MIDLYKRECLDFMESEEFKAIEILEDLREDSAVRFLDETLYEAIKELRMFAEDYRVVKKQNDYYNFENRACTNCNKFIKDGASSPYCSNIHKYGKIMIHKSIYDKFWCKEWEELL